MRALWMMLLLLAGTAGAQEAAEDGAEDTSEEDGAQDPSEEDAAEDTSEEAPPAAAPPEEADAAVEPEPEDDPEPELEGPTELEAELARRARARAAEAEAKARRKQDLKRRIMSKPQLSLFLGGQKVFVQDPGWGLVSPQDSAEAFAGEFTVWLHPNIGAAVGWSDTGEATRTVEYYEPIEGGSLRVDSRVRHVDFGVRGALAPEWLPVRPVARAAFGLRGVDVTVVDSNVSGNLRGREESGIAPFARLGGGIEVLTPRHVGKDWRDKGAVRDLRWAIGVSIEGGVDLGGGGEIAAAGSVDLGDLGRLDLGPGWFRAGVVLLF